MIRGLRGLDLVGGDVVEVSPPFDPSGNTALVGATMMFEILCVLAEAVANAARPARVTGLPPGRRCAACQPPPIGTVRPSALRMRCSLSKSPTR